MLWLSSQIRYLTACERHRKGLAGLSMACPEYTEPLPFSPFPSAKWFLAVYTRDVWSRLPELPHPFMLGSILKIDSTKKICEKLQGECANTASWATNVGNERGEVVVSVLTDSESVSSLQELADGL